MSQPAFSLTGIIRKTGTYSIAIFAARALSFILLPIYTRRLTAADYAVVELLDLTATLISIFVAGRLGQGLFYYYAKRTDDQARNQYVSSALLGALLIGAVVGMIGFTGESAIARLIFGKPGYERCVRWLFAGLACNFTLEVGLCCLRAFDRADLYTRFVLFRMALTIGTTLVFIIPLKMRAEGVLLSNAVAGWLTTIALVFYIFRRVPIGFHGAYFYDLFLYSLPLAFSTLSEFSINFGDRFFLREAVSLSDLGLYSLAYKFAMIVSVVHLPFNVYWNAQMFNICSAQDGEKTYVRLATYVALGQTWVSLALILFTRPVLTVLVAPEFRSCADYVPLLVLAYLIRAIGAHFRSMLFIEKRTGLDARVSVLGGLASLAAYAVLIPRFGVWGAVYATLLGFSIVAVYGIILSQRVRTVDFEYARIVKIAGAAAIVLSLAAAVDTTSFAGQFAKACAGVILFPSLLLVSQFATAEEWRCLMPRMQTSHAVSS